MPEIELHDVRIHYEFDGRQDRPTLVLSNSLGTNLAMWSPQLDALQEHFSILRYDSRGHGQSSTPPGPYSLEQMGTDVIGLLDALELDRVHFCGLSVGAMVGQWLGVHAHGRLGRLVLSNTAAKIGSPEGWNQRIETVRQQGTEAIVSAVLERWYTNEFRRSTPEDVERTAAMLLSTDAEGYASTCAAIRDMDLRADVQKISVPTLVVYGTQDPVTPPSEARFLIEQITDTRSLELEAAHLSNIEAASAFTAGVLDFLLARSTEGGSHG